ncbi:MAG: hypothetical protein JW863_23340 [Chitinispirillaceae bacterium]|nr:hypothetical protein [Chitinispirillaceae bacterium]
MALMLLKLRATGLHLLFAGILGFTAAAFSPLDQELPPDIIEAEAYLAAGLIDSTLWLQLLPFYRRPLQVPAGEAVELLEVFPELAGSIPTDERLLTRYHPWDTAARERLYSDFPVMKRLLPVLRFEYHQTKYGGSASFHMNNPVDGTPAKHSLRFGLTPAGIVRLRGTVDATSDYARWERRMLSVQPRSWATLQMGNFTMAADKGLFYGYFPDDTTTEDDVVANWKYGSARSWNGARVALSGTTAAFPFRVRPSLEAFFHRRPAESVAGASVSVAAKKMVSVSCGISRLTTDEISDDASYLHATVKVAHRRLKSELYCGITLSEEVLVPFRWYTTITTGALRTGLTVTRLPGGYSAPRSALLRQFSGEIDDSDTLHAPVTLVRMNSTGTSGKVVSADPRCELWFRSGSIDHGTCQMQLALRGRKFNGTMLFSAEIPGTVGRDAGRSIRATTAWTPLPVLTVAMYHRCSVTERRYLRYRGTFVPAVGIFSPVRLEPSFSYIAESGRYPRCLAGIRQQLVLFDRTHTEFLVERDLSTAATAEKMRVEGRASFYF